MPRFIQKNRQNLLFNAEYDQKWRLEKQQIKAKIVARKGT